MKENDNFKYIGIMYIRMSVWKNMYNILFRVIKDYVKQYVYNLD